MTEQTAPGGDVSHESIMSGRVGPDIIAQMSIVRLTDPGCLIVIDERQEGEAPALSHAGYGMEERAREYDRPTGRSLVGARAIFRETDRSTLELGIQVDGDGKAP